MEDGLNQKTAFVYDGFNRLTSQTFANGDTWTHTYDAVRKLSQTSPRGVTTSYTYDVRDRVTATSASSASVPLASGPIVRNHAYDPAGHLLSVTEPTNSAANVAYTYDELGRVLSETSRGITHNYAYDLAGNRVRADYGTGRSVQTSYDALNRPESIVEGERATRYGYDLGGRAVILMAGNGQVTSNSYDALGRLKQRTLYRTQAMGEGDVMVRFEWTHDLLGNVMSQSETWPGEATRPGTRTTTMAYDANNRLIQETVNDPTAGVTTTVYAYDAANNRSRKQVTGGSEPGVWTYAYNEANQLKSWERRMDNTVLKSATLSYDAAGNRIGQAVTTLNSQPETLNTAYAWDAQDRLSSVTMPDGKVHDYEYDYRTRRIGTGVRTPSSAWRALTAIVFAGGLSLAEYDVSASASSSIENPASSIVQYVRGPDMGGGVGGMLYSLRGSTTVPVVKYSLSNGRGDIVAQADQGANLTWTASYEAYGKRTKETGTNQDKQRANSKDEDPTGLLNEGFRYRDIETGVWMSRDPAGFVDGPNLYAYVKQNPWSKFDPLGLAEKKTKAGEVYFIVNHETKQAYVGETSGSAQDRMSHAQHPARSLLDTKGTQTHVRQVMANDGWEADVKANGFETSGKDPVASARNHITKSAERAEFYSRQKEFEGYTFLNDESKLIGEDKAMAARSRFGASRTARAQVRDVSVGSGFFGGRKLSFNRPRGGGAGTAASLLATAAYALSSPDAYADDIESQVYSWAGAAAQARSGNLDFAGQADFTRQSHELGAAMTGGLPGANQAAVRQLLKAGGMHSGNASEDWSALGQIIKDNAN